MQKAEQDLLINCSLNKERSSKSAFAEFLGFALFSLSAFLEMNMVKKLYPICENHLFSKAYRKGKSDVTKYIAVYVLKNYDKKTVSTTKLGITVNRKLGKAVKRSRVKRIIRAAYRENMSYIKPGYLIIVAARGAAFDKCVKSTDISKDLLKSFKKLGITESV